MNDNQAVTSNRNTRAILKDLHTGLGSGVEETALILGRTPDEIQAILDGEENVDEDLEVKIRGIAEERKINLS
jgi:hypothetical protein